MKCLIASPNARCISAICIAFFFVVGCDGLFADLDDLAPPDDGDVGVEEVGPDGDTGDVDTGDVSQEGELPQVTTLEVEEIRSEGVTLRGELIDAGDPPATEYGFCIHTDADFQPEEGDGHCIEVDEELEGDEFATMYGEFYPGAEFYVRAWAENEAGTVYGEVMDFFLAIEKVASGNRFGCAIDEDAGLWCWGRNHRGQLGIGSDVFGSSTPERVGDRGWQAVSVSEMHACAIDEDAALWCWGDDSQGQLGSGDGYGGFSTTPQPVELDEDEPSEWRDVATGDEYSCAIDEDAALWCWGVADNVDVHLNMMVHPALGLDANDPGGHFTPQRVSFDGNWQTVSAGSEHTCAIDEDHELWCWGLNADRQLGAESNFSIAPYGYEPIPVETDARWQAVAAGARHTCGIDEEAELHCWGDNERGQLGVGDDSESESTPAEVVDVTPSAWRHISTGDDHSCASTEDGQLYCWGAGTYGRLGVDGESDRFLPTSVGSGGPWEFIAAGSDHSCAVAGEGRWQCWGLRPLGSSTPTAVALDEELTAIAAGESHSCALADGPEDSAWCWGHRQNFGIDGGSSDTEHHQSPQQITLAHAGGFSIAAGESHTCFVSVVGDAHCWGRGEEGQLGHGPMQDESIPVEVDDRLGDIQGWSMLVAGEHYSCGLDVDDELWCWGENDLGQLGLGSNDDDFGTPQRVSSDDGWLHVAAKFRHTCAIDVEEQLWCWGWNAHGQVGVEGEGQFEDDPQRVDNSSGWGDVAVGFGHTCGVDGNHQLWCWGRNNHGQLGLGSAEEGVISIAEPRHVDFAGGPDGGWSEVFAGWDHTCGIDADNGDLWCWGRMESGQLGTGLRGEHHRPTKVVADGVAESGDGWKALSMGNDHTLALRDDGSAWSWGSNVFGQLGNDAAWRFVPGSIADF